MECHSLYRQDEEERCVAEEGMKRERIKIKRRNTLKKGTAEFYRNLIKRKSNLEQFAKRTAK